MSKLPESHCPLGRIVDNHSKSVPIYIQPKDMRHKPAAAAAFHLLVVPALTDCKFEVKPSDVYELVHM